MAEHKVSVDLGGKELTITTGKWAKLAGGSAVVQLGGTMVLVAASAAKSAKPGLDFVPLFKEQYQLVIPQVYYDSPLLRPLRAALLDRHFRAEVAALPGYDVSAMGTLVAEVP